jgi:hypothetical protein
MMDPQKRARIPVATKLPKRIEPAVLRNSHGSADGANYSPDQIEFMTALDLYKRTWERPHPSWGQILDVALALGYRRRPRPHLRNVAAAARRANMTRAAYEFTRAMDRYMCDERRPFPTCHEVLAVIVELGYRKNGVLALLEQTMV